MVRLRDIRSCLPLSRFQQPGRPLWTVFKLFMLVNQLFVCGGSLPPWCFVGAAQVPRCDRSSPLLIHAQRELLSPLVGRNDPILESRCPSTASRFLEWFRRKRLHFFQSFTHWQPSPGSFNMLLRLQYNGASFAGSYFNRNDLTQASNANRTVEGLLEMALAASLPAKLDRIRASCLSRTDKGVSAEGNIAICALPDAVPGCEETFPSWASSLVVKSNAWLRKYGANATITGIYPLPRVSCDHWTEENVSTLGASLTLSKRYEYLVAPGADVDSYQCGNLQGFRAWNIPERLNLTAMREAACILEGCHDFRAFTAKHGYSRNTTRNVLSIQVEHSHASGGDDDIGHGLVKIVVDGESFLYNMVRRIAFCLVLVGRNQKRPEWAAKLLKEGQKSTLRRSKCFSKGLQAAPAHGLSLVEIRLRDEASAARWLQNAVAEDCNSR